MKRKKGSFKCRRNAGLLRVCIFVVVCLFFSFLVTRKWGRGWVVVVVVGLFCFNGILVRILNYFDRKAPRLFQANLALAECRCVCPVNRAKRHNS